MVIVFSRIRPRGRLVHPGSLGRLRFALGLVGFLQGRWVHSSLVVIGLFRGRRDHSESPLRSLGSPGVVGFTRVHTGGRWVCKWSLASLGFA